MEWDEFELKDIALGIFDGPHATPKEAESGPVFLGIPNLKPQGGIDLSNATFLSEQDFEIWTRRIIPKANDLVFSYEATLHRYAIIPEGLRCCLGRRLGLVRVDDSKADYRFVYYSFFSHAWKDQVDSRLISGATVERIPLIDFPSFKIKLPPLPIQRRIADVLGRYDASIENYQRQIGVIEAMAREIYREWFVRGRCPYARAQADGLPVEWIRKRVEDCFEILGGGTPSKDEPSYWENGTINWFTPTNVTASQEIFLKESSERITESGYKNSSARLFQAYSVMMTSRATIGAVAINTEPATTNQGFITCLANERFSHAFIYFWILHNKHIFELLANGATFLEITKGVFKDIEITMPPDEVLHNFDTIALPIFSKIENLQVQITQLRRMRNKLLPRLMSGQLEVAWQTTL